MGRLRFGLNFRWLKLRHFKLQEDTLAAGDNREAFVARLTVDDLKRKVGRTECVLLWRCGTSLKN